MEDYRVLEAKVQALDERIRLSLEEAEKRNGQRFDAQQDAITTALNAAEKAVNAAMAAAEKAVTKAEIAAEKRFESVNEFRKTLSDQTNSFITRNEYSVQHQTLVDRTISLENQLTEIRSKSEGRSDLWGVITGAIAIVLAGATFVLMLLTRHGTT